MCEYTFTKVNYIVFITCINNNSLEQSTLITNNSYTNPWHNNTFIMIHSFMLYILLLHLAKQVRANLSNSRMITSIPPTEKLLLPVLD